MRGELVALDLETTGLDPTQDQIIEIGAVRFRNGEVIDEFNELVDPGRPIPPIVSTLTGIQNDDLVGKPRLATVLPKLKEFVGDSPFVGHNIGFDASFLYKQGALQDNLRIDTYELASVLLPTAPRYNLTSLTQMLNFDIESAHRALYDAKATAFLYWKLWEKALTLPYGTLREILNLTGELTWDGRPVFEAALRERVPDETEAVYTLFTPDMTERKPLRPNDTQTKIKPEEIAATLDDGGSLAAAFPGYEHRPQQVSMAQAVAKAFNQTDHLIVEAGTGTGKSLAYLIPAVQWALRNNERVVISTNTINLQDQLLEKDIPAVRDALGVDFNAAIMKGRGNYLCPRRLLTVRRRRPSSVDELRVLAKILVWLLESPSGDRGEISLRGSEDYVMWSRLSAEDEGCTTHRCLVEMAGACPFYKARKAADAAHVLIVNHALLLSDAASDNAVLPPYDYVVIDEAHNLEEATTSSLSWRLDAPTLFRRLIDLGGVRRGLLGNLLTSLSASPTITEKDTKRLNKYISIIEEAATDMQAQIDKLFAAFRALLAEMNITRSDFAMQVRVLESVRKKSGFGQLESTWKVLREYFDAVSEAMGTVAAAVRRFEDIDQHAELLNSTETAARYLDEVRAQLNGFIAEPDDNTIYWINLSQDDALSLHSAPLHIGKLVTEKLWDSKKSVVLTSATLETRGNFDYLRDRLSAQTIKTLEVGSPFNYRESTLIYVPNDMPDPNEKSKYQQGVERALIELTTALDGRVLALFTSYTHLRTTAQAITPRLALGNIAVYDQSDGSSRQALLEGFKASPKGILLGTRSFWEGVDLPGDLLRAVVITRLPFSVPTDPVFASRADTYSDAFNDYTLPDAILRFRQGFGRLIRTRTDRGVVVVLDARVITKSYGRAFIESLPDCTTMKGALSNLPTAAVDWLRNE
ncbi:MAG: DEAD/DEAH box helicase [Chloroflexi bacterium]|nr:DEAD/DEAH box helicase [Chloroflexota bacterium]